MDLLGVYVADFAEMDVIPSRHLEKRKQLASFLVPPRN